MQTLVLGVSRMQGVGKASKQPYDMARVLVMQPIKPFAKEGLEITGYGYEVVEVALQAQVLEQFAAFKFPVQLDLETEMEARGGKLSPIVIGIHKKAA